MTAPAEPVLGIGGAGIDHILLIVVGENHTGRVELIVAVLVGGEGGHVDITQGAAFIEEGVEAAEAAHRETVAVVNLTGLGVGEVQVYNLVLVPGPGEISSVVELTHVVVEAQGHFHTLVVHAAAVQVNVAGGGSGGQTGVVELVEGAGLIIGSIDLQLAVKEVDVGTYLEGLGTLRLQLGVAATGVARHGTVVLDSAGIQEIQGGIRGVTYFGIGGANLPVREPLALETGDELRENTGQADGRIGDGTCRPEGGVPVCAERSVQVHAAAPAQLGIGKDGLVLVTVTVGEEHRVGAVTVNVVEVELVVHREKGTVDVVGAEGNVVNVGTHHAGEVDDVVSPVFIKGSQHLAELLLGVLVVAAVFTVLGTLGEEGVGAGVKLLLLHFVGAVVLGAGAQGEPLEGLVGELGASHEAVLVILPLLVLRNPVRVLHGVLEVVGPELGLETAAGVVALVDLDFAPVFAYREEVHGNHGVAVFTLGNHVLLCHVTVGDVDVHGQDVLEKVCGVAEADVLAVHVVVVDNAAGMGDRGRHVGLAALVTRRDGHGVDLVHARLEEVPGIVGGRSGQLGAPAVVGAGSRGAVGVLELRHHIGAGETGVVGVIHFQLVLVTLLGGDDDNAVGGGSTIQGSGGRTGEH